MKQITMLLSFSFAFCLLFCGCAQSVENGSAQQIIASEQDETTDLSTLTMPYIGMVLKSLDNPYFLRMKQGAESEADTLGVQVMVFASDSETDTAEQASMLYTMAGMAVDVLIAAPSGENLDNVLARAQESDKIVMSVDTELSADSCACYVGTDHYTAAYSLGEYAASLDRAENTGAVVLRGQAGDSAHDAREAGLTDALQANGVAVSGVYYCDSDADIAQKIVKELLENEDIGLICATSDSMALGALEACEDANQEIPIVSFDGMPEVVACIAKGKIAAAMAQDAYGIGQECIRTAVKLFRGEEVPKQVYIDAKLITQDNAQTYLNELGE